MKTKNFKCSQQELFAICLHAWESCNQNIAPFTALRPKYTSNYVAERKAEVQREASMPDSTQRRAISESMRTELKKTLKNALKTWRHLKRIISTSWPKDEVNVYLNEAGKPLYEEAYHLKWEAAYSLMNNANDFISKHALKLQEGENMSAAFMEDFKLAHSSYVSEYMAYLDAVRQARLGTDLLIDAQNKLYGDLMDMFGDAKTLFENKTAMYQQFVFDDVLKLVSGSNMAGLKGKVSNGAIPAAEIQDIILHIKELGESTDCDEEGRFIFSPLAAGIYTLEVEAPGYKSQSIPNIEVKTSKVSTVNVVLEHEE
jgi:hypothetical protein